MPSTTVTPSKACKLCGLIKPLEEYHRRSNGKDGRQSRCKECACAAARQWTIDNPGRRTESDRRLKARNPAKHHANTRRRNRAWRAANLERAREIDRAKAKRWARAHPEQNRERTKKWRKANPERVAYHNFKYRSYAPPPTPEVERLIREMRQQPCTYCGGPGGTVDHIIPLSCGGSNEADNLAPSCQPCNSRKRDKPLDEFLNERTI